MLELGSWQMATGVLASAVLVSAVRASWLLLLLGSPLITLVAVYAAGLVAWVMRYDDNDQADQLRRMQEAFRPLSFTTPSAWSAGLTRISWEEELPSSPIPLHSKASQQLRQRFDALLQLVRRDFILPWYLRLSPSPAFPNAVERTIRQSLAELVSRAEHIDWASVVSSKTVPAVKDLLDHYKRVEMTIGRNADTTIPLPPKHHPAVTPQHTPSLAPAAVEAHVHSLVDRLLQHILPPKERASSAVRVMAREIVANMILMPLIDMLSDGDFWNRLIEERGRRQLHEDKLVKKVLSALDSTRGPKTPRTPSKSRPVTTIALTTTRVEFDGFVKSLRRLKDVGKARQYRADIEREIRKAKEMERDSTSSGSSDSVRVREYIGRLDKARLVVDVRIEQLSGEDPHETLTSLNDLPDVSLHLILANQASTVPWLEHMERRGKSVCVQFWLLVESLKDPLEALEGPEEDHDLLLQSPPRSVTSADSKVMVDTPGVAAAADEDIRSLWYSYYENRLIDVPDDHREVVRRHALEGTMSHAASLAKARRAVFLSQRHIFQQMVENDWDDFRRTELYRKAVAELDAGCDSHENTRTVGIAPATPLPPTPPSTNLFKHLLSPGRRDQPILHSPHLNFFNKLGKVGTGVSQPSPARPSLSPVKSDYPEIALPPGAKHRQFLNRGQTWTSSADTAAQDRLSDSLGSLGSLVGSPEVEDRPPLFGSDSDEDKIDAEAQLRISKRQQDDLTAALTTIIAGQDTDDLHGAVVDGTPPGTNFTSPAASLILPDRPQVATQTVSIGRQPLHARSSENLRASLSETRGRPSDSLQHSLSFPLANDGNHRLVESDDEDGSVAPAALSASTPGSFHDQPLHIAIAKLREQELVHGDQIQQLESYVGLAELHASDEMLRLCRQSLARVRKDLASVQLRITNYTQQQAESRLIHGETTATIPTVRPVDGVYWFDILVIRRSSSDVDGQTWTITKRFSQFSDLKKNLNEWIDGMQPSRRSKLRQMMKQTPEFPAKSVITKSSLLQEHRRQALERYIQSLLSMPELCHSVELQRFLDRMPKDLSISLSLLQKSLESVTGADGREEENSFQKLLTAVGSIGGQFVDDLTAGPTIMINSVQTALTLQAAEMTRNFGDMVNSTDDEAEPNFVQPLQDLCMAFLDYDASAWTLRRPAVIGTLQAIAGTIEKQARAAPGKLFSFEATERYITSLQESLWPDGQRRPPSTPRTEEEQRRSRVDAEKLLFLIIPDAVVAFCGRKYILKGVKRSLAILQDRRLNQHLILTTLDHIMDALYPPSTNT